jgi:hypothetical protein
MFRLFYNDFSLHGFVFEDFLAYPAGSRRGMRKKTTIGSPDFWGTPIVALLGEGRVE